MTSSTSDPVSMDPFILAERIRAHLPNENVERKRMFGTLAFMLDGHLACCASPKGLIARIGAEASARAIASDAHASPFHGSSRPMPAFVLIAPDGLTSDRDLARWVGLSVDHARSLTPKEKKPRVAKHRK